jgi:hypothetical protein
MPEAEEELTTPQAAGQHGEGEFGGQGRATRTRGEFEVIDERAVAECNDRQTASNCIPQPKIPRFPRRAFYFNGNLI